MLFAIKKILDPFLQPLGFCLVLAGVGLLLAALKKRRTGMTLAAAALLLLWAFSTQPLSRALILPLEARFAPYPEEHGPQVDYVVVLGAGHSSDPRLPVTAHLSGQAMGRLVEGIRILRMNPGSMLVLSGAGVTDPIPESRVMARAAVALGVDPGRIIEEPASRDTKDQAILLPPLLHGRPFALVTSAYHMPRAVALFRKAGSAPIPAPAAHLARPGSLRFSPMPSADSLGRSNKAFHEYFGLLWARLRGQV
ncbi:MAG: ElyC/SanA/YdcF family protein [Thermodesulfobacteriota bacterium]